MVTLTRWNPTRDLAGLEIDRLNEMFGAVIDAPAGSAWWPPVDIFETPSHDVVVKMEIPAVKREDITITLEERVLTVAGERKLLEQVKDDQYRHRERRFGAFSRSFTLPASVDGANVHASYADGVLSITLPQKAEAKPRQIAISE